MTFEVKLLITFVATDPLVIVTKFGRNPIKHVGEEANCEKEERRKKELDTFAITDGVPCRRKWSEVDLEPLNAIESQVNAYLWAT